MNCYCDECSEWESNNDMSEFIGQSRREATRDLRKSTCWISPKRRYFLCEKHNTKENRKNYILKEKHERE